VFHAYNTGSIDTSGPPCYTTRIRASKTVYIRYVDSVFPAYNTGSIGASLHP